MALEGRTTNDLVRVAAAGGGMRINVSGRTVNDVVRIAAAAKSKKAILFLIGLDGLTTNDLVRIAAAGDGAVVFDDGAS